MYSIIIGYDRIMVLQVVAVYREAVMNVLRENIDSRCIHQCHFLEALNVVSPKTSKDAVASYERYRKSRT